MTFSDLGNLLGDNLDLKGLPMKDVIQEKFGNGIISAIDFSINFDKVEDIKGDRVKVSMCGKFLS